MKILARDRDLDGIASLCMMHQDWGRAKKRLTQKGCDRDRNTGTTAGAGPEHVVCSEAMAGTQRTTHVASPAGAGPDTERDALSEPG